MQFGKGLISRIEFCEESRNIRRVFFVLLLEYVALIFDFLKVIDIPIRQRASKFKISQQALIIAHFIINVFAQRIKVNFFQHFNPLPFFSTGDVLNLSLLSFFSTFFILKLSFLSKFLALSFFNLTTGLVLDFLISIVLNFLIF